MDVTVNAGAVVKHHQKNNPPSGAPQTLVAVMSRAVQFAAAHAQVPFHAAVRAANALERCAAVTDALTVARQTVVVVAPAIYEFPAIPDTSALGL